MERFRCLFTIDSITHYPTYSSMKASARYDLSIPEDERFYAATPSGDITLVLNNPRAVDAMQPGAKFYVDFIALPITEPTGS